MTLALAFLSGALALSYEILWYRAYSFASAGRAETFGLMLGAYLAGIAAGSWGVRRFCGGNDPDSRRRQARIFVGLILVSNAFGFLVPGALARLAAAGAGWKATLPMVGIGAASLGAVFPLVTHLGVPPDDRAGARVSYVYLANILGSTLGSLLTGFVLMDVVPFGKATALLAMAGLGMAGLSLFLSSERPVIRVVSLGIIGLIGLGLYGSAPLLYDSFYERLQFKQEYRPGMRFAEVVETKSGVITVTQDGKIFGGGIYDGAFNTGLDDDVNTIVRAYALGALHPAPREVLMIGLSSGSWAMVVANHPGVERLTVIEINPGYLQLIPRYPMVAGLLNHPKVKIEIDDGRRWLVRNKDRRFDVILSNTTFHWRSNASNLLSVEYLDLIRSRLKPGGVYYYNTTGSQRVQKTGARAFPHAVKIMNFLALSESPVEFNIARWKEVLSSYRMEGRPLFDLSRPDGPARLEAVVGKLAGHVESRETVLGRPGEDVPITDDNMGTEWE